MVSIEKWQNVWRQLLDMTFYRKNVTSSIVSENAGGEYVDIYSFARDHPGGYQITFQHMWREYSRYQDSNGNFLEPQVVPELEKLRVPQILFYTLGVESFMKECFPNCVITYWEDK